MDKNAKPYAAQIPPGVQSFFGEQVRLRRRIESILMDVFSGWGYEEVIVPMFDYLEAFAQGLGQRLLERTHNFLDRDGKVLALRPDLTTLVAKAVATKLVNSPPPYRLMYAGEVFRYEKPKAGRQREFYQIGLEHIGNGGVAADTEVLLIIIECMRRLKLRDFKITLGHVGFFNGIAEALEMPEGKAERLRELIDQKDVLSLKREIDGLNLPEQKKSFLVELPHLSGGRGVLARAMSTVRNLRSRAALQRLDAIYRILAALRLSKYVTFDLGEVRDLGYYTGIVFKIYVRGLGFEVGGGGRYDSLLSCFGRDLPAVGFSFSLERLVEAGRKLDAAGRNKRQDRAAPGTLKATEDRLAEVFQQAVRLREKGRKVSLLYEDVKRR